MLSDGIFIPPMILFVPCGFWIIEGQALQFRAMGT